MNLEKIQTGPNNFSDNSHNNLVWKKVKYTSGTGIEDKFVKNI